MSWPLSLNRVSTLLLNDNRVEGKLNFFNLENPSERGDPIYISRPCPYLYLEKRELSL